MVPNGNGQPLELPDRGGDVCISILKKPSGEYYIILYRDEFRQKALTQCGRWASDEELSYTWYDAAVQAQYIRKQADEKASKRLA